MKGEITISSQQNQQLIDITNQIKNFVLKAKTKEGILVVFAPHTTASLLITEDEEGLKNDWINFFANILPFDNFQHNKIDNNANSHILSGIMGNSLTFIIENHQLVLGAWQKIFLVELDGPRKRKVFVKILEG